MINSIVKFIGYISAKWLLFYIYQFLESGNKLNQITNHEGRILAAIMLLLLPVIEILVLYLPFQFALKQKGLLTIFILFLAFAIEFSIGWFATNQKYEIWMVIKILLSVILFFLFYRRQLNLQ